MFIGIVGMGVVRSLRCSEFTLRSLVWFSERCVSVVCVFYGVIGMN